MALLYRRAARMDVVPLVERPTISVRPAGELTPPALGHGKADFEAHSPAQSATERFVYALYCGCDPRRGRDHEKDYVIRVYDWRGNHVVDDKLDRYVGAIAVSPDDSILYGAIEDPAPMVAEWILPATLRNRRDRDPRPGWTEASWSMAWPLVGVAMMEPALAIAWPGSSDVVSLDSRENGGGPGLVARLVFKTSWPG